MKKIFLTLILCGTLFAQNTDKNELYLNADESLWRSFQATLEALRVVNVGVDTIYHAIPDTTEDYRLTYGDSIFSVSHTIGRFLVHFAMTDTLVASSGTLTDTCVVELWNDYTSSWVRLGVIDQQTGITVTSMIPGSGNTKIYTVRLPYASYNKTIRVRRTNVSNIVGRETYITMWSEG